MFQRESYMSPIVGGGVSGLHPRWRLKKGESNKRIVGFEASGRIEEGLSPPPART